MTEITKFELKIRRRVHVYQHEETNPHEVDVRRQSQGDGGPQQWFALEWTTCGALVKSLHIVHTLKSVRVYCERQRGEGKVKSTLVKWSDMPH